METESTDRSPMVEISRQAFTTADYKRASGYSRKEKSGFQLGKAIKSACLPADGCSPSSLLKFFPFVTMLSTYKVGEYLLGDVIAGISISVIHIPQGLGFALLTKVPAVYGLYSSFFPVLFYFMFGTSRHISWGTMAVPSLLVGACVDRATSALQLAAPAGNGTMDSDFDLVAMQVGVACTVSLIIGVMQILMGVCRLGVLASFMSPPFIGGFLTGTGFHIATSQVTSLLGLKIRPISGIGKIPLVAIEVAKNFASVNIADIIIAIICSTMLVVLKEIINKRYAHRLKAPIPAELIAVALGILASYFGNFHERYGVRVVGEIPRGFPTPAMPSLVGASDYFGDAVVVAVLSFVVSISMAKVFARKHRYDIDANQEFLAYGIANAGGAFFHCFAGAQAPPRSLVQEGVGGRTQVSSIFSCVLVLIVILVAAPLFGPLPISVLACVLIVAILPLFYVLDNLKYYWRVSKYDFTVWMVTCLMVTLVDISVGLVVGVLASLLTVVANTRLARGLLLGRAATSSTGGIYAPQRDRSLVKAVSGLHIFQYPAPLYFANIINFKEQLFAATVDPRTADPRTAGETDVLPTDKTDVGETVILDCSGITYIDSMALQLFRQLADDYAAVDVKLVLCCCSDRLVIQLQAADVIADDGEAPKAGKVEIQIYQTVHDAVVAMESRAAV